MPYRRGERSLSETNGNGRKIEAAVDSTLAKAVARFGVPALLGLVAWFAAGAWQEQQAINRQVAENARAIAVHDIRLDDHDRRLGWLESRRAQIDPTGGPAR